jgi:hypothetical protein
MGRYQRSSRPPPIQSGRKETIKYGVLTSLAVIFLYRMHRNFNNDNEDLLLLSTSHDDAEYSSIRKAVPQDYDQPEKSMEEYSVGRHREEKSRTKLVELLLLAAEPRQISDHAREQLPPWVKLYFEWYRQQPVDSNQLVVKNLRYLDAAVYAAAQMNRLIKLDLDETTMVGASPSTLDWKLPTMTGSRRMRTLYTWDDLDAVDDAIVFGSTEFLQSVAVTTAKDALSASLFGPLWHSVFQPSPLLLQQVRTNLDQNAITAGRFAAVHCRAGYSNSVAAAPDHDTDALLLLKAKRAIQCGQWALKQAHQDFVDIYFISSNEHLNDLVRSQGGDMLVSPTGLERIIIPEPAHPSRLSQVARNGKISSLHDDWWVDLYTAIVSRCMVYGEGDFGEIASKVANTDCQVRHEETKVGTAPMCPADL